MDPNGNAELTADVAVGKVKHKKILDESELPENAVVVSYTYGVQYRRKDITFLPFGHSAKGFEDLDDLLHHKNEVQNALVLREWLLTYFKTINAKRLAGNLGAPTVDEINSHITAVASLLLGVWPKSVSYLRAIAEAGWKAKELMDELVLHGYKRGERLWDLWNQTEKKGHFEELMADTATLPDLVDLVQTQG